MTQNIRELMERWARWRIARRQGGYGKTFTQKCIEGMPGTNCPACSGRGRLPGAVIAGKASWVICANCRGSGHVDLQRQRAPRRVPCPLHCGPTFLNRSEKSGELNGRTCPRCRGEGTVIESFVTVNPATIRSTFQAPDDPVSERIDRLVCELRLRDATHSYYFVIRAEYMDPRGGTQEMKAQRINLSHGAYCMRLQRALDWIDSAMPDMRPCDVIPFPFRMEKISEII